MNPLGAAAAAAALAVAGHLLGWLNAGGAVAAAVVGGIVFAGGGLPGAGLLALFFVTGSLLTRRSSGERPARTGWQVLANGTCPALGAALIPTTALGWPLLAGALAAAQADTWATEIGQFAKRPTRLITTGAPVEPGTSGGVTWSGTFGGLAGAIILGGVARLLGMEPAVAVAAVVGGVVGFMLDSVLGATIQRRYLCETCSAETESKVHSCGSTCKATRGWPWLDNNGVNFVSVGVGGLIALGLCV